MEIFLIIIGIILLYIILIHNNFIRKETAVKQAESAINVYLKNRFDLIPNLIEVVKEYSKYESGTIDKITKLRSSYINNENTKEGLALDNRVNKLIAVAESYPELKASEGYINLQDALIKCENKIEAARRILNVEVANYNIYIQTFPNSIFLGKKPKFDMFEISDEEAENIVINI